MSSYKFYQKIDPLAGITQNEGSGTPEGVVTGYIGQRFLNTDNNDLYIKSSGENTNTGWQLINKLGWSGEVNTFADLPAVASNSGRAYLVKTSTGSISTSDKKYAGVYLSNGTDWIILGYKQENVVNELLNNFNPATSISAINSTDSIKVGFQKTQKYFNDFLTNFNGANQLVKLDSNGKLVAIDGSSLTNVTASQPTGSYVITIATSVTGALACDGSSYSKTTYSNLYSLITTELGANALEDPANSSNFILGADFVGRALGLIGGGRTLFEKAGSDTHVLIENEIPSHKHITGTKRIFDSTDGQYGVAFQNQGPVQFPLLRFDIDGANTANYDLDYTSNTGGGQAHSSVQKTAHIGRLFIYY